MLSSKHSTKDRKGFAAQRHDMAVATRTPKRVVVSGKSAGHDTLRRVRTPKRSPNMDTVAGVWIDRRKAIIAVMTADGDVVTEIHAGVERKPSRIGGVQSTTTYEPQLVQSDDRRERGFTRHLDQYYDQVAKTLGDTQSVLIFGPGEAKGEFRKHLGNVGHSKRVIAMEADSGMSLRQILAKIRTHFRPKAI